jgi:cytochrome c oxidase subunit I+III
MHLPMLWLLGFFATFVIGGLTGVMLAVVPFDWQAHDTHFVVAHLHYVLIGGYVFPMVAAVYFFMPIFSGRTRFFKLGEVAFWLVVPAFHVTFLAVHIAGLLGQRRRTWTYDAGQGWEGINLVASIGAFVMAIGFALVILDVIVNALVATRGRRNPWGATTLEWATSMPSPPTTSPRSRWCGGRYPLHDDRDIAVSIAKGEGYLGCPLRDRRETLVVSTRGASPRRWRCCRATPCCPSSWPW